MSVLPTFNRRAIDPSCEKTERSKLLERLRLSQLVQVIVTCRIPDRGETAFGESHHTAAGAQSSLTAIITRELEPWFVGRGRVTRKSLIEQVGLRHVAPAQLILGLRVDLGSGGADGLPEMATRPERARGVPYPRMHARSCHRRRGVAQLLVQLGLALNRHRSSKSGLTVLCPQVDSPLRNICSPSWKYPVKDLFNYLRGSHYIRRLSDRGTKRLAAGQVGLGQSLEACEFLQRPSTVHNVHSSGGTARPDSSVAVTVAVSSQNMTYPPTHDHRTSTDKETRNDH